MSLTFVLKLCQVQVGCFLKKHFEEMLLLTIVLTSLIVKTSAECGTCGATSNAACISEDQYYRCVNGVPDINQILLCPTGSVCGNVAGVCDSVTFTPSCIVCATCNSLTVGYACLSQTTLSPCLTGSSINFPIDCPAGTMCHTTGTLINPCTTLTSSQTARCQIGDPPISSTTVAPSTPGFIASPQSFCRSNSPGFYKNPNDSYCRTYIYCYRRLGMRGMLMTCNGNYIFNPSTRSCVVPGTYVCPAI